MELEAMWGPLECLECGSTYTYNNIRKTEAKCSEFESSLMPFFKYCC